jgi:hypothetical protein
MTSPATIEKYYKIAKDLNDAKPCPYFKNYVLPYCRRGFEIRSKLTLQVSMFNSYDLMTSTMIIVGFRAGCRRKGMAF